jgi:hypothetical protein
MEDPVGSQKIGVTTSWSPVSCVLITAPPWSSRGGFAPEKYGASSPASAAAAQPDAVCWGRTMPRSLPTRLGPAAEDDEQPAEAAVGDADAGSPRRVAATSPRVTQTAARRRLPMPGRWVRAEAG